MSEVETIKAQRDALLSALERLLAVLPQPGGWDYMNHYARIEADEARAVVSDVKSSGVKR